MTCPRCHQENPAEAHFCMKCGAGLTLACAKCNTELPTGAAFCFACGQPVAAARKLSSRMRQWASEICESPSCAGSLWHEERR